MTLAPRVSCSSVVEYLDKLTERLRLASMSRNRFCFSEYARVTDRQVIFLKTLLL